MNLNRTISFSREDKRAKTCWSNCCREELSEKFSLAFRPILKVFVKDLLEKVPLNSNGMADFIQVKLNMDLNMSTIISTIYDYHHL